MRIAPGYDDAHRRGRLPWTVFLVVAIALAGVGPVSALRSPARATGCSGFSALAAADGVRIHAESRGLTLVEQVDVAAPAAQAVANTLGLSMAYAGFVWPGETVMSLFGQAGIPRDNYPLAVESSYPFSPESSLEAEAVSLEARSEPTSSVAQARGGLASDGDVSGGRTQATGRVSCGADGIVTASAESSAEALSFAGGVLRIGRIRAIAEVVAGDGEPSIRSDLAVEQVTVAGQAIAVSDKGLVLAGSTVPLLDDDTLLSVLDDAGITVTVLAASFDHDGRGVVAPALQVGVTRAGIGPEPTRLTFTFGRVHARAVGVAEAVAVDAGTNGDAGDVGPTLDDDSLRSPVAPVGESHGGGEADGSSTARQGTGMGHPRDLPAGGTISESDSLQPSGLLPAAWNFSLLSVYGVVVTAAALLATGGLLVRVLGIKPMWRLS